MNEPLDRDFKEDLGVVTQEEALEAVVKYKHKELLSLIEEAVTLKRADKSNEKELDKEQLDLDLDRMDNEANGTKE